MKKTHSNPKSDQNLPLPSLLKFLFLCSCIESLCIHNPHDFPFPLPFVSPFPVKIFPALLDARQPPVRNLNMESTVFDNVRVEKEKAVARFNRFRKIVKLWQIFEVLVVLGLVSWSSARVPAVMKVAGASFVEFSAYVFNHHVVFIIGNFIIVLLFVICRQNDALSLSGGGDDLYDDYVKHSEAVHPREPPPTGNTGPAAEEDCPGDDEKQIVVCSEEIKATPQSDEVATAIEMATRQIRRFQRTQSEKLKREIAVRPRLELRRSETEKYQRREDSETESFEASEIDTLSSDEFRRTVEAFIDKHWCKKSNSPNQFENCGNYHLVKTT